jgi:hypothetical protein
MRRGTATRSMTGSRKSVAARIRSRSPRHASSSGSFSSTVHSTTSSRGRPRALVIASMASIFAKNRRAPSIVASSSSRNAASSGRSTAIAPVSHRSHIERWADVRRRRRISSKTRGRAAFARSSRVETIAS